MDRAKYMGQEPFVPGQVVFYLDGKSEHQVDEVSPSVYYINIKTLTLQCSCRTILTTRL